MNLRKILAGILISSSFAVISGQTATNTPPRFRVERIAEWENFSFSVDLLLNNRNQLAATLDGEDGLHFSIRGAKKVKTIPLPGNLDLFGWNAAGTALFWDGSTHSAYRYRNGEFANYTNFLPYKSFNTSAINDRGVIVGGAQKDASSHITPYRFYRGHYRELGKLLPNSHALALAVNNRGVTVGAAQYRTNGTYPIDNLHAVIFRGNHAQDLGVLEGGVASKATGINNQGVIIGDCSIRQPVPDGERIIIRGFVYREGVMSPLQPLPGHTDSKPKGISKNGWIVGESRDDEKDERIAVLFLDGETFDLNDLLPPDTYLELTSAESINDRGVIAAMSFGEAFLLIPE